MCQVKMVKFRMFAHIDTATTYKKQESESFYT